MTRIRGLEALMCDSAGEFRSYQDGFLLDGGKLTRIVDIIADFGKRVHPDSYLQFRVEKAGKRFYTTRDLSHVLKDDNSGHDGISSVSATLCMPEMSGDDELETSTTVNFRKEGATRVDIIVGLTSDPAKATEGRNREWCALLISELEQQMTRVLQRRPFHALTFRAADFVTALFVGSAFLGVLLTTSWAPRLTAGPGPNAVLGWRELMSQAILHSSPLWLWWGVVIFSALVFTTNEYRPVSRFAGNVEQSVFLWGDGVERHRRSRARQSKVLWSVLVAFGVSLVASAVATWLLPAP